MSFLFSRKGEGAEGLGHSQVTRSWSVVAQSMPAQVTVSQPESLVGGIRTKECKEQESKVSPGPLGVAGADR